jgi:hypothetical protein
MKFRSAMVPLPLALLLMLTPVPSFTKASAQLVELRRVQHERKKLADVVVESGAKTLAEIGRQPGLTPEQKARLQEMRLRIIQCCEG